MELSLCLPDYEYRHTAFRSTAPWHFLNFLSLPQGHFSFRPIFFLYIVGSTSALKSASMILPRSVLITLEKFSRTALLITSLCLPLTLRLNSTFDERALSSRNSPTAGFNSCW